MEIVVAGSHGLIGEALVARLTGRGHTVRRLVRPGGPPGPADAPWDPRRGELDPAVLATADAVVNLGGVGVGDRRWTDAYRREIRLSRTLGTLLLARTLADLAARAGTGGRPRVLLQASASGWYGERGDEPLPESAPRGDGFLADVVADWEASASPAADAGVRVVLLRTAIVLSRSGGALGRLLPIVRAGVGGPLGTGRQYWSWVSLPDHVAACEHLLVTDSVAGPVNLTSPEPVRNADLVRALASALHRPAVLRVPEVALRVGLGGFASELVASRRQVPAVLHASGFRWEHPAVVDAAEWVAAR
ncbi:TIGR01777 family oxidoreductase [Luteimicrobium subarcticum]|uniref:TIGR01777 family protein n=1 Tax=Luteimicrobium subarcticum TaxID=620910 RepID=A0A2M8WRA6_9MICO|nr:TIGR01777 family oxidoreductase [Luteimicrobium subarcticum]PJI93465.1 hypothetical protein CLV34_2039 [Luteimicrobium subarcticum]